jgi:transcriptional regulator with XRE-family HTH domain
MRIAGGCWVGVVVAVVAPARPKPRARWSASTYVAEQKVSEFQLTQAISPNPLFRPRRPGARPSRPGRPESAALSWKEKIRQAGFGGVESLSRQALHRGQPPAQGRQVRTEGVNIRARNPGEAALGYKDLTQPPSYWILPSTMEEAATDLTQRIAERVRELRAAQGLSLDALASKSGVSRSMISLIERGESSPTAVVLEKLAVGLGVMLASLFDAPAAAVQGPSGPVARRDDQPQWQDPASGYLRRNVSPPGVPQPMQIVEVHFPPGGRVAFETGGRDMRVHQQVWVLEGAIDITLGVECHQLRKGDCLAMELDRPTMFHNPTRKPARYAVVIASDTPSRR